MPSRRNGVASHHTRARDGLHSVTRGTLVLLLGTVGFIAANFVARVILVRNLGPLEFSEFYLALTLAGLLTALGQLGIPQAVARSISFSPDPAARRGIVRAGFRVGIPLAIGAGVAMYLISIPIANQFHSPLLALALEFFSVEVAASILANQFASVFQGFEDVKPNALIVNILTPLLFIAFLVVFTTTGPGGFPLGYPGALLAYTLSNVFGLAAIFVYFERRAHRTLPPGPRDARAGRAMLWFAVPLFAVGILSFLAGALDTLLLGFFHNSEAGTYGADLSLARLVPVGMGALSYILLPVLAKFARSEDPAAARVVYATATKWMAVLSLPVFLVFFFFPGPSLAFVYKAIYAQSTRPLQILVLGSFLGTIIGPATTAQVSFGMTRSLLYNNLAAALADGVLGLLLIPTYGTVGAAIAWAVAVVLVPALSIAELAYVYGFHPFLRPYVLSLLVTGVPFALLFARFPLVPGNGLLIVLVLLVALAFVLVVVLTRSIDWGDRILLEAVESMIGRRVPGARWVARRFAPGVLTEADPVDAGRP
jgi:O-antigen/teichoic acid export membrane protein